MSEQDSKRVKRLGGYLATAVLALCGVACAPGSSLGDLGMSRSSLIVLGPDDSLQAAVDAANPGDIIQLASGATYSGPLVLPNKPVVTGSDADYITITADPVRLPPPGTRIDPTYASGLPKISCPNGSSAIKTAPGAHHFAFVGVEFPPPETHADNQILLLADQQTSLPQVPHHFRFRQIYAHTTDGVIVRRGIALNSAYTRIEDSYLAGFHDPSFDSQAIAGWAGPGPYWIINNYLEGASENIIFGGEDPSIDGLVPSDIDIERNTVVKPLRWIGAGFNVKNLLELKNARRVVINGNTFQNDWPDGQAGTAILFTVRNQNNGCPWCTVQSVKFVNNVIYNAQGAVQFLGIDDCQGRPPDCLSVEARDITIRNNLFYNIWGGAPFFQSTSGDNIIVDHNDCFEAYAITKPVGAATTGFKFTNNIIKHGLYGFWISIPSTLSDSGQTIVTCDRCSQDPSDPLYFRFGCVDPYAPSNGNGFSSNSECQIAAYNYLIKEQFPSAIIAGNLVLDAPSPPVFPDDPGNFFSGLGEAGFTDLAGGNYQLLETSPYHNAATDGTDIGVDFQALAAAQFENRPSPAQLITIIAPADGAIVSGTVTLTASVTVDDVREVQFYLDGAPLGGARTAPYSLSWDSTGAAAGSHTLAATAFSAGGSADSSAPITITVKPTDAHWAASSGCGVGGAARPSAWLTVFWILSGFISWRGHFRPAARPRMRNRKRDSALLHPVNT